MREVANDGSEQPLLSTETVPRREVTGLLADLLLVLGAFLLFRMER